LRVKTTAAILAQWRREDPDRLLGCALRQAKELAEVAPELERLRAQNAWLSEQLEVKTKCITELQEALEALQRVAYRQAAPFRIPEHKRIPKPKPPGRKAGHPGAFRHQPDHIDEFIEVQLCTCPHCGGERFSDQSKLEQTIEDIPPGRAHVTRLITYQATCLQCGKSVRSGHPLQMSLATGAAGVQLGPQALALAADLNKAKGLSMRKTCAVLRDCFGLHLSPGGLSQALDRPLLPLRCRSGVARSEIAAVRCLRVGVGVHQPCTQENGRFTVGLMLKGQSCPGSGRGVA
jgi:transposase